jgi:hypothetical protein
MAIKCPLCGAAMERRLGFSGDLYQSNDSRIVCTKCGYGGPCEEDVVAEALRKIQPEREETGNG